MTQENRDALEVLLANRSYLYALLHKLFGERPDDALLDVLTSEATGAAFSLLSEEPGDIMDKVPHFLQEVQEDRQDPEYLDGLKEEYTRLFIGPARVPAPPWESIYRGKEGMLFQESTLEVRRFYERYGLKKATPYNIADDSLALELDFMAHLAQRAQEALAAQAEADSVTGAQEVAAPAAGKTCTPCAQEALQRSLEGSLKFLDEHMLYWIPLFLDKMKDSETQNLYPQLCLVLDDFLKKDRAFLAQALALLA